MSRPERDVVTVGEAALVLGLSHQMVRKLLRDGKLRGRLAGPTWIINRASLSRLKDSRRKKQERKLK